MISGRGTQIIADSRGAYLAGNLRALIEGLDADRRFRLRIEYLRLGIHVAESWLRFEDGMRELDALNAVKQWADHPDPNAIPDVYAILDPPQPPPWTGPEEDGVTLQGLIVWVYLGRVMDHPDLAAAAGDALAPLAFRMRDAYPGRRAPMESAYAKARQWMLDAAWAMLQGKQPPPIPEVAP
jgi:hypothetical protein